MAWLAWCPDRGQTEEDGHIVANNPFALGRDAAEQYARECLNFYSNPFDHVKVYVKDLEKNSGVVYEYIVVVEAEPVFVGKLLREMK